ncbi:MAG: hypothetical protein H2057_01290 [Alphaproteobacteria bacterium]|nr:hypothetical protein [Alphaproteobacteria bacterium]
MTYGDDKSTYDIDTLKLALVRQKDQRFRVGASLAFPEEIPLGYDYNQILRHLYFYAEGVTKGICVTDHDVTVIASDFRDPQWLRQKMSPLVVLSLVEGPIYPDPWPEAYTEPITAWFLPKP